MEEGKAEELKGRAKEAVGDLTDNEKLQREGKADKASGTIKDKMNDIVDKVRNAVRRDR